MYDKIEKHLEIIARYDEVICDKAPKHALSELRFEMEQNFKVVSDLSAQT